MIGTLAYKCGGDLHNPQAVLRSGLLLARDTQLQARSAASSHSLSPFQTIAVFRTRNRHIADGWDIVVVRLSPAVHGVFRDGFKARVPCRRSSMALVQEPWRNGAASRKRPEGLGGKR